MAEVRAGESFTRPLIIPLHPPLADADDRRRAFESQRLPGLSLRIGIPGDRSHLDRQFLLDIGLGHEWLSPDHQCSVREKPLDEFSAPEDPLIRRRRAPFSP
jgi:hypothetical protein